MSRIGNPVNHLSELLQYDWSTETGHLSRLPLKKRVAINYIKGLFIYLSATGF